MAATIWYEKDADLSVFDGKKSPSSVMAPRATRMR